MSDFSFGKRPESMYAAKALGEETIVGFLVEARKRTT
jgi:hypothetical protein